MWGQPPSAVRRAQPGLLNARWYIHESRNPHLPETYFTTPVANR